MTERPTAFALPAVFPKKLSLFFGRGDYVIAATAHAAAVSWTAHFDESSRATEFTALPEDELIELYIEATDATLQIMPIERVRHLTEPSHRIASASAAEIIERFCPGYLASTTEDD